MLNKIRLFFKTYAGWILIIFHLVGIALLGGSWRHDLVILTPLNLLLIGGLYLNTSSKPTNVWLYGLPALLGFAIEVIGTNTGVPFGAYTYSGILGPRLFATPLMLGLLWWVLIRSWFDVSRNWAQSLWLRSFITGLGMVGMDLLIEPVAIELNFWRWTDVTVPLENYIAWFVLSTLFARLTAVGDARNPLSKWILPVLTGFFAILCIFYQ